MEGDSRQQEQVALGNGSEEFAGIVFPREGEGRFSCYIPQNLHFSSLSFLEGMLVRSFDTGRIKLLGGSRKLGLFKQPCPGKQETSDVF